MFSNLIKIIVLISFIGAGFGANKKRYVSIDTCDCSLLECNCCTGTSLPFMEDHSVCLNVKGIPNELTLITSLLVDGNNVYTHQLDPSAAAVCPPQLPGICWAVNHVNLSEHEVCSKLTAVSSLTLLKFPCVKITPAGKLEVNKNIYN